jgi:zinc/manganese transport system ATP-binding protein
LSAVAFEHVTLSVGGRQVLSDIGFDIRPGEFIGVLGPNGSGKTTLIKAVLGLIAPDHGRVKVFGVSARRGMAGIAYLPQLRAMPPEIALSGRDFIAAAIGGERWGLPLIGGAASRALDQALALVNGTELAERPLSRMSGGERQRLLIAGALAGNPRLLLLDEPLISLDQHQQSVIVDLVGRLSGELGLTVLFSAHELNQLLGAVDRLLYLGHGQAALGTVDEVITPSILSRLYGAPIEVVRAGGRIFVMSGGTHVEREHHHDHAHL